jgi:putative YphP/YqiW family bacilliredoxin
LDLNANFVQPMRDELIRLGFRELRTAADVDAALGAKSGTALVFVNSVCGCAAGMARPGMARALERTAARPDALVTVFAGQDREATARAREHFGVVPPSSPSVVLLKDGALVAFLPRHQIEGRSADLLAAQLVGMLESHCTANA